MTTKFALKKKSRDSYLELVTQFPLASIQSEEHFREAQKVMDRLATQDLLDDGETLYLDALCDLIAGYEDTHYSIEAASDAELLRHFLEAKGITQVTLSKQAGLPRSSISEVLSGKKQLTRQMIRKLASYFQVDPAVFAGNL